jgi:hypothetical protein
VRWHVLRLLLADGRVTQRKLWQNVDSLFLYSAVYIDIKFDDPRCPTQVGFARVSSARFTRVQAQVNGFGVNAKIPGIEVLMECETSIRRKS